MLACKDPVASSLKGFLTLDWICFPLCHVLQLDLPSLKGSLCPRPAFLSALLCPPSLYLPILSVYFRFCRQSFLLDSFVTFRSVGRSPGWPLCQAALHCTAVRRRGDCPGVCLVLFFGGVFLVARHFPAALPWDLREPVPPAHPVVPWACPSPSASRMPRGVPAGKPVLPSCLLPFLCDWEV